MASRPNNRSDSDRSQPGVQYSLLPRPWSDGIISNPDKSELAHTPADWAERAWTTVLEAIDTYHDRGCTEAKCSKRHPSCTHHDHCDPEVFCQHILVDPEDWVDQHRNSAHNHAADDDAKPTS